ncbi:MAG: hypothetical protein ACRDIY_11765 [Chloroflexota bacterium]
MATTIRAVFDGKVLRPEQPIGLQPEKTYEITIEREVSPGEGPGSDEYPLTEIARIARDLGVENLSTEHDRYARSRIRNQSDDA